MWSHFPKAKHSVSCVCGLQLASLFYLIIIFFLIREACLKDVKEVLKEKKGAEEIVEEGQGEVTATPASVYL